MYLCNIRIYIFIFFRTRQLRIRSGKEIGQNDRQPIFAESSVPHSQTENNCSDTQRQADALQQWKESEGAKNYH